ncbi:uncharacterized mitochondrial protein-like protein [Tanacetum coccineum]
MGAGIEVYVDDIIFGSTNKDLCTGYEKLMKDKFQMSSMGELTFFLGLQVQQKEDGIFISQDKYIAEILKKFNYTDVKSASTPVDLEKPLVKDRDADDVDVHLYRSMIRYEHCVQSTNRRAKREDHSNSRGYAVCLCNRLWKGLPFYENIKNLSQNLDTDIYTEVKEFERSLDKMESDYDKCLADNKRLGDKNKHLLAKTRRLQRVMTNLSNDNDAIIANK